MSLFQRYLLVSWRAWRLLSARASSSTSGRQQLVRPQHLRLLGTASGGSGGNVATSSVFALALGSVVLGLGGYYVGARSNHHPILTPVESESPGSPSKPVYGTPEDFARAIEELKTLFSEETVTTAKDQLEAHGFSPNVYHPGKYL
jgi:D-lactate dehydrogenase (cytochrome)